jgi:hypothetical protein
MEGLNVSQLAKAENILSQKKIYLFFDRNGKPLFVPNIHEVNIASISNKGGRDLRQATRAVFNSYFRKSEKRQLISIAKRILACNFAECDEVDRFYGACVTILAILIVTDKEINKDCENCGNLRTKKEEYRRNAYGFLACGIEWRDMNPVMRGYRHLCDVIEGLLY